MLWVAGGNPQPPALSDNPTWPLWNRNFEGMGGSNRKNHLWGGGGGGGYGYLGLGLGLTQTLSHISSKRTYSHHPHSFWSFVRHLLINSGKKEKILKEAKKANPCLKNEWNRYKRHKLYSTASVQFILGVANWMKPKQKLIELHWTQSVGLLFDWFDNRP